MRAGQKSVRASIEDFLCPFTDMYITQGARGNFSHKGTCSNDVRGLYPNVRYDYYAPCTVKCLRLYPETGQSMWQSVNKVRFANGRIDYATFMLAHDDNLYNNAWVGKVVTQGDKLGTMGTKGVATGVHCHIQISQSKDEAWIKKASFYYDGKTYPIYGFNNEYDPDYCYFVDNTNIIEGMGGEWKVTSDIPVEEVKKSVEEIARECIQGLWDNNEERVRKIEAAGYNYEEVRNKVNEILNKEKGGLVKGAYVKIIKEGNGSSEGDSNTAVPGYEGTITDIYNKDRCGEDRPYPYEVSDSEGVLGYFAVDALYRIR